MQKDILKGKYLSNAKLRPCRCKNSSFSFVYRHLNFGVNVHMHTICCEATYISIKIAFYFYKNVRYPRFPDACGPHCFPVHLFIGCLTIAFELLCDNRMRQCSAKDISQVYHVPPSPEMLILFAKPGSLKSSQRESGVPAGVSLADTIFRPYRFTMQISIFKVLRSPLIDYDPRCHC